MDRRNYFHGEIVDTIRDGEQSINGQYFNVTRSDALQVETVTDHSHEHAHTRRAQGSCAWSVVEQHGLYRHYNAYM